MGGKAAAGAVLLAAGACLCCLGHGMCELVVGFPAATCVARRQRLRRPCEHARSGCTSSPRDTGSGFA